MENELKQIMFDRIVKDRFFYGFSFGIYHESGIYDFGPIGCAIQSNILNEWRKCFVIKENMLEIDCAILTPESVLKASGHLAKFNDYMVKDSITNEAFRVDHLLKSELEKKIAANNVSSSFDLIKNVLKKIENSQIQNLDDIDRVIEQFDIKSPLTGNKLQKTEPFNLMFKTFNGPAGNSRAFVLDLIVLMIYFWLSLM
jgi:glycyl-tRNA synthetase